MNMWWNRSCIFKILPVLITSGIHHKSKEFKHQQVNLPLPIWEEPRASQSMFQIDVSVDCTYKQRKSFCFHEETKDPVLLWVFTLELMDPKEDYDPISSEYEWKSPWTLMMMGEMNEASCVENKQWHNDLLSSLVYFCVLLLGGS